MKCRPLFYFSYVMTWGLDGSLSTRIFMTFFMTPMVLSVPILLLRIGVSEQGVEGAQYRALLNPK